MELLLDHEQKHHNFVVPRRFKPSSRFLQIPFLQIQQCILIWEREREQLGGWKWEVVVTAACGKVAPSRRGSSSASHVWKDTLPGRNSLQGEDAEFYRSI